MATQAQSQTYSTLATDPLRVFRFGATFTPAGGASKFFNTGVGSWAMGFTSISGLQITTQNIEYREGGMNTTVHQVPGLTTFQPVVFNRGVIAGNDQALVWMRGLFAAALGSGLDTSADASFRADIVITVNSHPNAKGAVNKPQMAFKLHNAWVTNISYSDLDAQNGAILFERMTVIHEGMSAYFVEPSNEAATTPFGSNVSGDKTAISSF